MNTTELDPLEELAKAHGFDAEEELTKLLSAEIAAEIDNEIVTAVINSANNESKAEELYDIVTSTFTKVITVTAPRASGKTTVLRNLLDKLLEGQDFQNILVLLHSTAMIEHFLHGFNNKHPVNFRNKQIHFFETFVQVGVLDGRQNNILCGTKFDLILMDEPQLEFTNEMDLKAYMAGRPDTKVLAVGTFDPEQFPLSADFQTSL